MSQNILKNRRFWVFVVITAIVVVIFFDRRSIDERRQLRRDIEELKAQKEYYRSRIVEDSSLIEKLKDNDFLEQYAREHYLMHRPGDSVYILPPKRDSL